MQQAWPQQDWQQPMMQPMGGMQPQPWAPQPQQQVPLELSERDSQVLVFLAQHESVGPTDLVNAFGGSLSTWTRSLQSLEERGLLTKMGQKRYLTDAGRAFL